MSKQYTNKHTYIYEIRLHIDYPYERGVKFIFRQV